MGEVIDVIFVAFPDGRSIWLRPGDGEDAGALVKRHVEAWRDEMPADRLAELDATGCNLCVGQLRMPAETYHQIPSGNMFPWPTRDQDSR